MTDKAARAEIRAIRAEHAEVAEAVIDAVKSASPQAGPQRILAELRAAFAPRPTRG